MTNAQLWLDFYQHKAQDHQNRGLVDIWTMTFDELEKSHDFIQWLFPLPEPSPVNPHAPVLTTELIMKIHQTREVQNNLLRSFDTLSAFWGFVRNDDEEIGRSGQFEIQSKKWCCLQNHNQLRITRMLKCLSLTGHDELAATTCEFLLSEINAAGFSFSQVPSVTFWMNAIENQEEMELTMDDFEAEAR